MTLPASGSISFEMLNTEIQRPSDALLYMNDPVLREMAGIPSGAISMSDLYGKSYIFEKTVSATTTNLTLSSLFSVEEWTSNVPKRVIINSGVTVGATSVSNPAISVGIGMSGSLTLVNNGTISGAGGIPTNKNGGTAISCDIPIFIVNNGIIRAGGAAGGKGGNGGQGVVYNYQTEGPYYSGLTYRWDYNSGNGANTLRWNNALIGNFNTHSSTITVGSYTYVRGAYQGNIYYSISRQLATPIVTYTSGGTGGLGGRGQGYDGAAAAGSSGSAGGTNAGNGGQGGSGSSWGVSGLTGLSGQNGNYTNGTSGEAGGLGGYAITGYNAALHTNNGTILGRL